MDLTHATQDFSEYWLPILVFLGSFFLILCVRNIIYRLLSRLAVRTATPLDDVIIQTTRFASLLWCLFIAIYLSMNFVDVPEAVFEKLNQGLAVLLFLSVTIVFSQIVIKLVNYYLDRSQLKLPVTGLTHTLIRILIFTFGTLILMSFLGISIMPIITALGIGGLAVALALQESLANLFSGIHLMMEKAVKVGDYVELESGEVGYVNDIDWRTTRILDRQNNIIIVPNKKLAESIITNFSLPEKRYYAKVLISVSYDEDPDNIEKELIEIATAAMEQLPDLLADPPPAVQFNPGFKDFSLDFTLIVAIKEVNERYEIESELRKLIFKRFRQAGIQIPFPTHTVHIQTK